jgi:hypothetical protein
MHALVHIVGAAWDGRWPEMLDAAAAQLALLRAQMLLWTRSRGSLVGTARSGEWSAASGDETQRLLCERLARAVSRAARLGVFRPRCLARALALSDLLTAHGVSGHRIRIGVRREGGTVIAHAWVELGAWVLGDTLDSTRTYAPLSDVHVAAVRFSR